MEVGVVSASYITHAQYGNVLTERDHKKSNSQDDGRMEGDVEGVGEREGEVIRVVKVCKRQPYHDSCCI